MVSDKPMKKIKHNDWLYEQLREPGFAAEYLTAAAEDEEPVVFLRALRKVAEAQGMAEVAGQRVSSSMAAYNDARIRSNRSWSLMRPLPSDRQEAQAEDASPPRVPLQSVGFPLSFSPPEFTGGRTALIPTYGECVCALIQPHPPLVPLKLVGF